MKKFKAIFFMVIGLCTCALLFHNSNVLAADWKQPSICPSLSTTVKSVTGSALATEIDGMKYEPNDTMDTANTLSLNQPFFATILTQNDVDYYKVDVPIMVQADLVLKLPNTLFGYMYKVELLAKNEANKWYTKECFFSYSSYTYASQYTIPAGSYYIRVSVTGDTRKDVSNGEYSIELDITKELEASDFFINSSHDTQKFNVGDSYQLTAKCTSRTISNLQLSWSTSNPYVATVNQSGIITCHDAGYATITAVSQIDSSIRDTISIEVKNPNNVVYKKPSKPCVADEDDDEDDDIPGTMYQIDEVETGDTVNLDFNYDDEEDPQYTSSDRRIASVNRHGSVYFKKPGSVIISVRTANGFIDTYPFVVSVLSDDCTIKRIKATKGIVKKTGNNSFLITLSSKQKSTVIVPVLNDSKSTYKINGSYAESKKIKVRSTAVYVRIQVIAEDGSSRSYKVKVERER